MILDRRIRRLGGEKFRFLLTTDDILDINEENVCDVFDGGVTERAVLFIDKPIIYPHIHYYKLFKIYSNDIEELKDVIFSYLFLNPSIGDGGLKKMANFISENHLYYVDLETPSFGFDYVLDLCYKLHELYPNGDIDITEIDKVILFKNFTKLSRDVKRMYSNSARSSRIKGLWEDIIHSSAQYAINNTERFKIISKPMVMASSKSLVNSGSIEKEIKSLSVYNKYIHKRTIKLLAKDGLKRYIHDRSFEKWKEFLRLDIDNLSLKETASKLSVSNSTVIDFRWIRDKYKQYNK